MVVHKRILVLANSVKKGAGRCIAGREIVAAGDNKYQLGPWLRPVTGHGEGELWPQERLYNDGRAVGVMDFADAPLERKLDEPCQPENWLLADSQRWIDASKRYERPGHALLEERPADLWLQPDQQSDRVSHDYLSGHPPAQSLYVIRPERFRLSFWSTIWDGYTKKKRRCLFRYQGADYDMGLTDPMLSDRFEAQIPAPGRPALEVRLPCGDDLLLCVSLAGAFQGYHYKLVATVLEGV